MNEHIFLKDYIILYKTPEKDNFLLNVLDECKKNENIDPDAVELVLNFLKKKCSLEDIKKSHEKINELTKYITTDEKLTETEYLEFFEEQLSKE